MNPIVKWAGGKRKLAPVILDELGDLDCLVEPFFGGGAVSFASNSPKLVIGDANRDLVNMYFQLMSNTPGFIRALDDLDKVVTKERYSLYRKVFNANRGETSARHAAMMLWLNKACFRGLWRENLKGEMNTPVGEEKPIPLPSREALIATGVFLRRRCIATFAGTWQDLFDYYSPTGMFRHHTQGGRVGVYLDPPFQGTFSAYTGGGWSTMNWRELLKAAAIMSTHGWRVVISNSIEAEEVAREELRGTDFKVRVVSSNRGIIRPDGGQKAKTDEILITIGPAR